MKKITFAAVIAVILLAVFSLQSKAQTRTVNIEELSSLNTKTVSDIKSTPVYNKNGKLLYTVKRYEASALPNTVRRIVSNQFYDFDIAGVEEVILPSDNNSIYLVHIMNDKKLETVRVYNNECEVIQEFKKG